MESAPYLGDTYYFPLLTHGTNGVAAPDATPTWAIFVNGTAAAVQTGNYAQRGALTHQFVGTCALTTGNGFTANDVVEVVGIAVIGGNTWKTVVDHFVLRANPGSAGTINESVNTDDSVVSTSG